nr:C39 family peptidase [uncultured Oscillibacter sp.]
MRKSASPSRTRRNLALIILLAVLCVGAVELAACSFFAPAVYEQITAPVRQGAQTAALACGRAAAALSQASEEAHRLVSRRISAAGVQTAVLWSRLTAPKEEALPEEDIQLADDPVLTGGGPAADPAVTELNVINGQEILTGGTIPIVYFNQGSETWADQPYGTDDIGRYGCGPTAMAMVVGSMTEADTDPLQMAQLAVSLGHWAKRGGSYLSVVEGLASASGLTAVSLQERTPDALMDALTGSNLLVALMGPGHFTKGGHFIVLRGVTLSGKILVADPNSQERSLMEWEPELILEELSRSTSDGAPLWVISQNPPYGG